MRTVLALEALGLIEDIGKHVGTQIDAHSFEYLFSGVLRCATFTKKLVAIQSKTAMMTFLTTTSFHSCTIRLLLKALDGRVTQLRHFATLYLEIVLRTHGPREGPRMTIERGDNGEYVEKFLKKALVDAAPVVRVACRNTYWTFHSHWPTRAAR